MGLFSRGKSGGAMNVIRCDEQDYLVWKWRPAGQDVNSTSRENAIRYGSSLRVKDGEVAIFMYKQKNGTIQDYIVGPYDDTIKTANFPILSSIVGLAFGGESPFQAEVYYLNLAGVIQTKFAVPYFDVVDPRLPDFPVPVAVGGTLSFKMGDYKNFIKLHRLINFDLEDFKRQISDAIRRRVKSEVTNITLSESIPLVQIERKIEDVNDAVKAKLQQDITDFGVEMVRFDIARIDIDKESEGWHQMRHLTATQQARTIEAQTDINLKNLADMQRINAENMEETLRIQREEAQRAQRLQTEQQHIGAHALNLQAGVLGTAADNLGEMSAMGGGNGGMNPAGMMTGMMLGGAMGNQMAQMMNTMGNTVNQQMQQNQPGMGQPGMGQPGMGQPGMPNQQAGMGQPGMPNQQAGGMTPPPMPGAVGNSYMVSINGQQAGPFTVDQMQQLVANGSMNAQSYVWCQGMPQWATAGTVPELAVLFAPTPPPMPGGVPPMPGGVPPMPGM